jgi:hypothetical protein
MMAKDVTELAELAAATTLPDRTADGDDRAPAAPTIDDLWQLLGRADVLMRALLETPNGAARRGCEDRARKFLHDIAQAWVHTPAPRSPAPWPRAGGRA